MRVNALYGIILFVVQEPAGVGDAPKLYPRS